MEAYEQLVAEGFLESRAGGATRVARGATTTPVVRADLAMPSWPFDFRPGRPDVTEFPRAAWLRSIRRVLAEAPADRFSYLGGRGVPELRIALAGYLNRVRGMAVAPETVVVSTGFIQGLGLIARALAARGARRMGVEDPSDGEYRRSVVEGGLAVVPIPVDDAGILVERLDAADVDAVLVTAAHQYPTGGVLPPERRAALVDWADRRSGWVIEDDYDAEFRYDREPIGALQGLRPERVIYAGSASKTLAPGLRLGWIAAPPVLVDGLTDAKLAADHGSPVIDQLALADFIGRGELDRHLRRHAPDLPRPPRHPARGDRPPPAGAATSRRVGRPPRARVASTRRRRGGDPRGGRRGGDRDVRHQVALDHRRRSPGPRVRLRADPRGAHRGGRRAPGRGHRGRPRGSRPRGPAEPAAARTPGVDAVGIGRPPGRPQRRMCRCFDQPVEQPQRALPCSLAIWELRWDTCWA